MTVTSQPLALDPYDYAFQEDPYPVYAWLREHEPLHHNPTLDLWALTRHADIAEAVRTEGTYSNSWGVAIEESAWGPDAHKVMSILGRSGCVRWSRAASPRAASTTCCRGSSS